MSECVRNVSGDTQQHASEQKLPCTSVAPSAIDDVHIQNMIYTVREQQVMLDSDLAKLYGVETKVLNQAVTRNPNRFPERFCFVLSKAEYQNLKSQIVTSSSESWGGRRKLPRVFTEQGVSMLSAVLRSPTAVSVSVKIMDAFVEMRHFIADNASMFEQIRAVERRQVEYQLETKVRLDKCDERFERVFDYMEAHTAPTQKIFFEGQIYDAFEFVVSLIQQAKHTITLIDNYVDISTLNIFAKKAHGVDVAIYTNPRTQLTNQDVETFNAQYPTLSVHRTSSFHDRFLIMDNAEGYLIGASLKDVGKKSFAVARLEDARMIDAILKSLVSGNVSGDVHF